MKDVLAEYRRALAAVDRIAEAECAKRQRAPIPLIPNKTPAPEFPIDALGSGLGGAARAITEVAQCPLAIAGQSVLAAAALVGQGFYNVVIDGRSSPLSLFLLTIADSGDRKSAADNIAIQPVLDWQKEARREYDAAHAQYKAERAAYDSELSRIKGDRKKSFKEKADAILALGEEPRPPTSPRLLCSEPTLEGLQKSYLSGQPAQGLFSDEGGQFFGGHAMSPDSVQRSVAGLSKFWDGNRPIDRTRAASEESLLLYNRRLSIHLMVQPIIASSVLSDPLLAQQGILARFLVAATDSLAGTRFYNRQSPASRPEILEYQARLKALLDTPRETDDDGGLVLADMPLSDEAHSLWVASYNALEKGLGTGGELRHIKATVSKLPENIARMAGVMAFYDGQSEITAEHMRNAITLGSYYLRCALKLADAAEQDVDLKRASELLEWIKARGSVISISEISKAGPRGCGARSVKTARRLMVLLEEYGHVITVGRNQRSQPDVWEVIEHV